MIPLTHPQKRIYVNQMIFENSKFAHMYGMVHISDQSGERILWAIQKAVAFFDCLRLRLRRESKEVFQYISDDLNLPVEERPFDYDFHKEELSLFEAPLCRFFLVKKNEEACGYYFIFHHVAVDAYTVTLVTKYIEDLLLDNPVETEIRSALDYCKKEREYLNETKCSLDEAYFEERLSAAHCYQYVPEFDIRCNRIERALDGEETKRLLGFCKANGISVFKLIYISAFLLFFEKNGKTTQLISTSHHNRTTDALLKTGGMFVGTIPVVSAIDEGWTFQDFLERTSSNISDALERHEYPVDLLLGKMKKRDCFDIALTEVLINSIPFANTVYRIERFSPNEDVAKYNFKINPHSKPKGSDIELALDYRLTCCSEWEAERTLERLLEIAFYFIEYSGDTIASKIQKTSDIFDMIESKWEQNEDAPALSDRNEKLTYKEIMEAVDRVAYAIRDAGYLIGVVNSRSLWYVVSVLGILRSGRAFVVLDPELPKLRINSILSQTKITTVLVSEPDQNRLFKQGFCLNVKTLNQPGYPIEKRISDLAYILFTSGTTGTPKGVMIRRSGLSSLIQAMIDFYPQAGRDRRDPLVSATENSDESEGIAKAEGQSDRSSNSEGVLGFCNFDFDVSVAEIFFALASGSTLYIASEEERRNIRMLNDKIIEENISHLFLPTKVGEMFIDHFPNTKVKTLTIAGERMTYYQKTAYQVYNAYGPTEFTVFSHINRIDAVSDGYSFGTPLSGIRDYVLDESGNEADAGELVLEGEQAAYGYLNDYEATTRSFRRNRFYTGDLVERGKKGELYFRSRKDRQIKYSGYRIELDEIEHAAKASGLVEKAACVYDGEAIHLTVVPKETYSEQELVKQLKIRLPSYAVPKRIVVDSSISLGRTGKTDYSRIRGVPNEKTDSESRSDTDDKLISIFQEFLDGTVDSKTNFINEGIDSLSLLEIILHLEREFHTDIRFSDLFLYPTIENLGTYLDRGTKSTYGRVTRIRDGNGSPVVLLFDMSGEVLAYRNLIEQIETKRPIITISSRFIPKEADIGRFCDELTAELFHTMREGEHFDIAGYSSGGIFALLIAMRMKDRCNQLFLMDTPNYARYPERANKLMTLLWKNVFSILSQYGFLPSVKYLFGRIRLLFQRRWIFDEQKKMTKMLKGYSIDTIPDRTTLIATKELEELTDRKLGWGDMIEDSSVVRLNVGHVTLMKKKNAETIANVISGRDEQDV